MDVRPAPRFALPAGMWIRHLTQNLTTIVVVAAVVLFMTGRLPGVTVAHALLGFVLLKLSLLAIEAFRKPLSPDHWDKVRQDLLREWDELPPEEMIDAADASIPDGPATRDEMADAYVKMLRANEKPRRSRIEIAADALGVVTFCLLLPFAIALFVYDFVSLQRPEGFASVAIVLTLLFLYALPHLFLKDSDFRSFRVLWWGFLFVPALLAVAYGIDSRHPYLNPFLENHSRLAAERVIALNRAGRTIEAGDNGRWVINYAWELDKQGKTQEAAFFFREGLRLDSSDRQAWLRLAAIEETPVETNANAKAPHEPLWAADTVFPPQELCSVGRSLENLTEYTVVIVRVGPVSDHLVAAVAYSVGNELNLPVLLSDKVIPLPDPTRNFLAGRQWSVDALYRSVFGTMEVIPKAPVLYLLLTEVDIHNDRSNYVFSGSFQGVAVVSACRFGAGVPEEVALHRVSKQTLAALIKSLGVPASPNVNCVTTYTRSLSEFDSKGNRPSPETQDMFRRKVEEENRRWVAYRFGPGFFR